MLLITTFIPPGHIASGIPLPPLHLDTSHPEFLRRHSIQTHHIRNFSAATPSGHITSRIPPAAIPPGCPRIQKFFSANILSEHLVSENSPPPTFYPAYRIRNSPSAIPFGKIASGIPPPPFHLDVPRIRNSSSPTFHLPWISHIRNPIL
uniref:Uncharacterized protein n=1 Tax=Vitis vinifera TaxID=29760 RepID=A5BPH9_VITVI|nr:hypothetical protein VITISV_015676 [Vitis vinifera]